MRHKLIRGIRSLASRITDLRPRAAVRALASYALAWCVLGVAQLVLFFALPDTAWQAAQLEARARLSLLYLELAATVLPAIVLVFPVSILDRYQRSSSGDERVNRWWPRVTVLAVVWVLLILYGTSWASFRSTRQFLDVDGLHFWVTNALQFFQHVSHMEPYTLLGIPLIAAAGALFFVFGIPWLADRLDHRSRRTAVAGTGVVVAVLLLAGWGDVAGAGSPVIDPDVGVVYTKGDLYATLREERTGPVTHFVADLHHLLSEDLGPRLATDEIPRVWKPLMTMEEYLERADRSDVDRLNVIFVIVESLRNDQLTAYGGEREVMPEVEALAGSGRFFTNHYTQSSHSNYSDLAPLSSHYPLRSRRTHVYPEEPSYPRVLIYDILDALGYHVGVFSSQNENWGGMIHYLKTGSIDRFLHAETFEGPTYVPQEDDGFAAFIKGSKRSGKIDDRFTVGAAIEWIDALQGEPFFIYMNLQNSHIPYDTPADFPPRFGPGEVSFPITFGYFPPDSVDAVKDLYANSLAYVDSQLARLFGYLKDSDQWDRTVIVVTGDTGQGFWEHGFIAHAKELYNEVMKVPLIIRAPGLEPGGDDRLAQHIDVPPSLLELLGLPPHPSFQGRNLFAERPPQDPPAFLVAQSPLAHQYAMVRSGFKLIYDARWDRYLLYDLRRDPGEKRNLSGALPKVTRVMATWLDTWRKAQIDYYTSPHVHTRYYPPVLAVPASADLPAED